MLTIVSEFVEDQMCSCPCHRLSQNAALEIVPTLDSFPVGRIFDIGGRPLPLSSPLPPDDQLYCVFVLFSPGSQAPQHLYHPRHKALVMLALPKSICEMRHFYRVYYVQNHCSTDIFHSIEK